MPKTEDPQYPLPSNPDYLSYYVYQGEWKPTRPIGPIGAMTCSPGPAIVNLPTTIGEKYHDLTRPKAPGYKIGQKLPYGKTRTGPGPGAYDIRELSNKGKDNCRAPKFDKARRFKADDQLQKSLMSPGPAVYDRQQGDKAVFHRAPGFSMPKAKRAPSDSKISDMPGPNAYTLPPSFGPGKTPYLTGPSFSIGKGPRSQESKHPGERPGPASYLLPSTDVNMHRAPAFSMGTKAAPPSADSTGFAFGPGPAIYSSHLVKYNKYSTPRITFGIRHSPYKAMPGFAAEK